MSGSKPYTTAHDQERSVGVYLAESISHYVIFS